MLAPSVLSYSSSSHHWHQSDVVDVIVVFSSLIIASWLVFTAAERSCKVPGDHIEELEAAVVVANDCVSLSARI